MNEFEAPIKKSRHHSHSTIHSRRQQACQAADKQVLWKENFLQKSSFTSDSNRHMANKNVVTFVAKCPQPCYAAGVCFELNQTPANTSTVPATCNSVIFSCRKITAMPAPITGSRLIKIPTSEAGNSFKTRLYQK